MPRKSTDLRIPVIDLFAGPGGLGEGFSAPARVGGSGRFRIALSVEKDPVAHQTLELRALFRQFPHGEAPEEYYRFVRGEIGREELFSAKRVRAAAVAATQEAWNCELGLEPEVEVQRRVRRALGGHPVSVLIGGPPCQAYSLVGRSRNRGNPVYDPASDGRHTLYREYLKVLAGQWPAVFVMENVKGLLSARLDGESIFARIIADLQDPAAALKMSSGRRPKHRYRLLALTSDFAGRLFADDVLADPRAFVVRSERYGVPQARHRVILVGVRDDLRGAALRRLAGGREITVGQVISDLPPVRSGLSKQADSLDDWLCTLADAVRASWFKAMKRGDPAGGSRKVADRMVEAVDEARSRAIDRGGEFVRGRAKPAAHREWYCDARIGGVLNHSARSHIAGDIHRYLFASAFAATHGYSPTLVDFPAGLLPRHENVGDPEKAIFADRFRVQLEDRPSTTVTSHISKDGHYYIHFDPSQARSLTAREAARLQTFPDNYFFCGGRTSQYQQIGNAVPPLLARQIAHVVSEILTESGA